MATKSKQNGRKSQNRAQNRTQIVTAPVAMSIKRANTQPQFRNSSRGTIVHHREYISAVFGTSTTNFTVNNNLGVGLYSVQPMNPPTFNWLVGIASHFDQYKIQNIRMEYIPLCATTEVGRVALFWDPDSQDSGPVDRTELASFRGCVDTPPWSPVTLNIPCDQKVRFLDDNPTIDFKLVDSGRVGYATYGTTTNNALGDVFIEYDVEFIYTQPMKTLTRFVTGNPTSLLSIDGPRLYDIAGTAANLITAAFFTPGTYQVFVITTGTTTTHNLPTASNGGIVSAFSQVGSATKSMSTYTVVVPNSRVQVQMSWVGSMTFFNIWASRGVALASATI
jgi:hypothetical protein